MIYYAIISLLEIFAKKKFIFETYFRNHIETSFNIGVLLQCDFIFIKIYSKTILQDNNDLDEYNIYKYCLYLFLL